MIKDCSTCLYTVIPHNMKRCYFCKNHDRWTSNQIFNKNQECNCLIPPRNIFICLKCKKI